VLQLSNSTSEVGIYAVDPDLHFTSLIGLDAKGNLIAFGQTEVASSLTGSRAAIALNRELRADAEGEGGACLPPRRILVIEDQRNYKGGKNVLSLILLSRAAGISLSIFTELLKPTHTIFVDADDWKGSVPKRIHQQRIVARSGLPAVQKGYKFKVEWPKPFEWARDLTATNQSHAIDALGIARWALERQAQLDRLA
jgi:hypothetical protein